MTVSTLNNRVSSAGNGVTTAFSFPNKFIANSDLVVLLVTDSTGVSVTQVLDTDYTVTGAGDDAGGTVTMTTAPATGTTLVIYRDPPMTQLVDLVNGDPFNVETSVEAPFDKLTLLIQRLRDLSDRAIRLNDGDTSGADPELPVPVADALIGWDTAGTALENKVPADIDLATVSPFILTLIDDTTAAAARTTLGAAGLTGNETIAGDKTLSGATTLSGGLTGNTVASGKITMTGKAIWTAEGAAVVSAADCNIWSAGDGNTVHITDVNPILDWGTAPQAGAWMWVIFDDATPLTYNATTNKLNTSGANYTTTAGDRALIYADTTAAYVVTIFPVSGKSLPESADVQTFTGSGTWTKPVGYSASAQVRVQLWGAGGAGAASNTASNACGGGGGGGYREKYFALSALAATETVTIGAGGIGALDDGPAGGNTTFGAHLTAYGGGGGARNGSTGGGGGGGGGTSAAGASATLSTGAAGGTSPAPGTDYDGGDGGAGGTPAVGESSVFGGGGGGGGPASGTAGPGFAGGGSIWGGGGGGAGGVDTSGGAGGSSLEGGAGGAGATGAANGTNGSAPGGGGGGAENPASKAGDGAAGKCIVTVFA